MADVIAGAGVTAEMIGPLDIVNADFWRLAAEEAKVNAPSAETRALVVKLLKERENKCQK